MLAPGVLLQNRYRIVRQIGHGGMGAVYEAQHEELGHTVALKETFHTDNEVVRKAFKREARLLAGLRHPALPRVHDYFTDDGGGLFLVMEYVPGDDLAKLLKDRGGAFPVEDVLRWAEQLLDVLSYLHTYDPPIIHRDIKPSNIKLASEDRIVLVDFGLAKGSLGLTTLVPSQSLLGFTPNFAPLEQILRVDANLIEHLSVIAEKKIEYIMERGTGPCSDLYSFGATLYHLLTNKLPTPAQTRALSVWSGRPDPLLTSHELNNDVPPALAFVLMRALALSSEERPSTAAEMRRMLVSARQAQTPATQDEQAERMRAAAAINPAPVRIKPEQPTDAAPPAARVISGSLSAVPPLPANANLLTVVIIKALHMIMVAMLLMAFMILIATSTGVYKDPSSEWAYFRFMGLGFGGGMIGAAVDIFSRGRFIRLLSLLGSGFLMGALILIGMSLVWGRPWPSYYEPVEIIRGIILIIALFGVIPATGGFIVSKVVNRYTRVRAKTP
ncbi:MAG: protein kinase [Pyrinomonadaceae bacterium]